MIGDLIYDIWSEELPEKVIRWNKKKRAELLLPLTNMIYHWMNEASFSEISAAILYFQDFEDEIFKQKFHKKAIEKLMSVKPEEEALLLWDLIILGQSVQSQYFLDTEKWGKFIDYIAVAAAYNEFPLETNESIALLQILQQRLNQNKVLWKFTLENVGQNLPSEDF